MGKKQKQPKIRKDDIVEFNPQSKGWKKIVAIILWILILFFSFKGVVGIITQEDSDSVKETMTDYYSELVTGDNAKFKAGTFAENYLTNYFTYDSENDTWEKRVSQYASSGFMPEENHSSIFTQDVKAIKVSRVNQKENGYIDVDVLCTVTTVGSENKGEKTVEKTITQTNLIRVPVRTDKNGNLGVVGSIVYVADDNDASKVANYQFDGEYVDNDILGTIKTTATNFFTAYYSNKPSNLKYYVTKDFGTVATVGNNIQFKEVSDISAVKENGVYRAYVTTTLNNGFNDFDQKCVLEMKKGEENRLYVSKLTTQ